MFSFSFKQDKNIKLPKAYVYVPPVTENGNVHQPHFYMLNHEVTNLEYMEFLYYLKNNHRKTDFEECLPDTTAWNFNESCSAEPMVAHYFRHPAYHGYPVVNITKRSAELFCEFLNVVFKDKLPAHLDYEFRLPTHEEWMRAAKGGNENNMYAWNGSTLRNMKGLYRANFYAVGEEFISRDDSGRLILTEAARTQGLFDDGAFFTASSQSYNPNDFGIYNMSGNVAEFILDSDEVCGGHWFSPGYDIRIESTESFKKPSPFVGFRPVFAVKEKPAK